MAAAVARLLAVALVSAVGGATAQAPVSDLTVSLTGPRSGLTAVYVVTDGGEITERCQEDRYPDRSVRIECASASSVSVRIDNVASGTHYELVGSTWAQYLLTPTPSPRLIIPAHMLQALSLDDSRSGLLELLPADHRQAYVWTQGGGRDTVVVPSLDMLVVWRHQVGDKGHATRWAVNGRAGCGAHAPPGAEVRVDRRARRTRLFDR